MISTHCHNDLGLATATTLEAIRRGARQVECTINGLGERAGNASLDEIVMGLRTRRDIYGLKDNLNIRELYRLSRLAAGLSGMEIPPNKAVVGAKRLRAPERHPSARRAARARHLRNHEALRNWAFRRAGWCWASSAGRPRAARACAGAGL